MMRVYARPAYISIVCKQAQRLPSEIFSGTLKVGWRSHKGASAREPSKQSTESYLGFHHGSPELIESHSSTCESVPHRQGYAKLGGHYRGGTRSTLQRL
jgi:hypothetical protein